MCGSYNYILISKKNVAKSEERDWRGSTLADDLIVEGDEVLGIVDDTVVSVVKDYVRHTDGR